MILHSAQVAKIDHWREHQGRIVDTIRSQMGQAAHERGLVPDDTEVMELVYMRWQDEPQVGYYSCEEADATHVRVTIERGVVE